MRLQGESLRLRLGQSEIARLRDQGAVEESVSFGSGAALVYRIQSDLHTEALQADFDGGVVTVHMAADRAQAWTSSDEVGVYGQNGGLSIAIEKDFRCLTLLSPSQMPSRTRPTDHRKETTNAHYDWRKT